MANPRKESRIERLWEEFQQGAAWADLLERVGEVREEEKHRIRSFGMSEEKMGVWKVRGAKIRAWCRACLRGRLAAALEGSECESDPLSVEGALETLGALPEGGARRELKAAILSTPGGAGLRDGSGRCEIEHGSRAEMERSIGLSFALFEWKGRHDPNGELRALAAKGAIGSAAAAAGGQGKARGI